MNENTKHDFHAEIVTIIDSPTTDVWNFNEIEELAKLYNIANEKQDVKAIRELKWEVDLLCPVFNCSNKWEDYETGEVEITKPYSGPHCTWNLEALDYYRSRFVEANSKLAKARYAFAIMTLSSGKDRFQYAEKSFNMWLESAKESLKSENDKGAVFLARLEYGVALRIALGLGQGKWVENAMSTIIGSISALLDENRYKETLPLFELITRRFDDLQRSKADGALLDKLKKECIELLQKSIEQSHSEGEGHFEQGFVSCLKKIVDEDEAYALMKRSAEIELTEAEKFPSALVRSSFMERALSIYREMQDSFKINQKETQGLIDNLIMEMKKIDVKSDMKTISTDLPMGEIVNKFEDILRKDCGNILDRIVHESFPLIDKTEALRQARAQKLETPLLFIFPVSVIGKDGVIREHRSEESILDFTARSNIMLGVKVTGAFLSTIFRDLKKEIGSSNELDKMLENHLIADIEPTIKKGLMAVLGEQKDPIIAAHLLIPYVEEIIRRIVVANGLADSFVGWEKQLGTGDKTLALKSITLGGLLDNEDVRTLLGASLVDSLKTFLIELDQGNYRNLSLHGLMTSDDFNDNDSAFVAYVMLKLINILSGASKES